MTFFKQFPKFAPLPLLNFGVDLKFHHIALCVYYQSWIMQSLVFLTYFLQKLSKKNLWGSARNPPPPPPVQEGLKPIYLHDNIHLYLQLKDLCTAKIYYIALAFGRKSHFQWVKKLSVSYIYIYTVSYC